jgi:hypothetical protein
MNRFRARKSGHTNEGVGRVNDGRHDYYSFYVRMQGHEDRDNLRKAIERLGRELGFVPSNPMLLSYLLRKFVGENKSEGTSSQ